MQDWIDLPASGLIAERSQPYFLREVDLPAAAGLLPSHGQLIVADVRGSKSALEVIEALKAVLPFPDWCGSSWDSIDDASPDLLEAWPFPLIVVIEGLPELWANSRHLAVQTVIRLSDISDSFSALGKQVVLAYVES